MASGGYGDDPTVPDDASLWRNIPPWHFVADENTGGIRPSSAAFMDDDDGSPMSVTLGDDVLMSGRTAESVIAHLDGFGLVAIPASAVRACGQIVVRDPTDAEPAHAIVVGRKTQSIRNKIRKNARWLIEPR